jgi:hypothetical protein
LIGLGSSALLVVSKFLDPETGLTNKPAFYIALATMVMGLQLFLTGFMAELVTRNASERNVYLMDEKCGW